MLRNALLLLPIVGILSLATPPAGVGAGGFPGLRSTTTAHGVRMTVVIPPRTYPRGALIAVDVWIHNQSSHGLTYAPDCSGQDPRVNVLSPNGSVRYPPGLAPLAPPRCPIAGKAALLKPHASLYSRAFVVLRGRLVRARWEYSIVGSSSTRAQIDSPRLSLVLTARQLPIVRVHSSPARVDVLPRPGIRGPLRYVSVAKCSDGNGATYSYSGDYWQAVKGTTITAPCPSPIAWHVLAGYVGGTAALIRFWGR
ncbi:MAG: hypothetical protein ACRDFX_12890 [Chloroflexota bacterium]